ncbi:Serine/threonine-protein kinase BtrW [Sporomusa ovata DSM 2662]|uniref:Serine-protein kinase RsbW n=1 Tax=Sporomusa ovata TaxID=2378 RepID=A0A0U1KV86_9FIRM|nr:ATP-binding protein [Sporomusa ovata]EQB26719.1 anti-sigma regulatory factor [Sporomusa ovata DSM 2662]CQR70813.1 Serine-protein kinase RsbW [Sporomusa ovata]
MVKKQMILKNNLDELEKLSANLEEFFEENDIAPKILFQVNLVLDELVTNIISYAYPDGLVHEMLIEISFADSTINLTVSDDGVAFDPTTIPEPDLNQSAEERELGGLGIYFVRQNMDCMEYQRLDGRNILFLQKVVGS